MQKRFGKPGKARKKTDLNAPTFTVADEVGGAGWGWGVRALESWKNWCENGVTGFWVAGRRLTYWPRPRCFASSGSPEGRGSQVVRQRSAKPLFVGSIPTRASKVFKVNPTEY